MRIRLGLLERNPHYIRRFIDYFSAHYTEEIEVFAFSEVERLEEHLKKTRVDVLLADDELLPDEFPVPKSTILAFLSETPDIRTIRDVQAVCKYQRAEQIYREVLNLYAELDRMASYRTAANHIPLLLFMGAAGGVGTTSLAAACATYLSRAGYKALYLNLEANGTVKEFFTGEGQSTLSDVLYAIKSSHANLAIKLESMVRRDESGVYFYEPFAVTLDGREMRGQDLEELLEVLTKYGAFDFVVADTESHITDKRETLLDYSSAVFLVSDGTQLSNTKLRRVLQEFAIRDEHEEERLLARTQVIYNRFDQNKRQLSSEYEENVFLLAPFNFGRTPKQVIQELAERGEFGKLV